MTRLPVICGDHDRPVDLGESWTLAVVDGDRRMEREQVSGNAVVETKRGVRWTCPKCRRQLSLPWRAWRGIVAEHRTNDGAPIDIAKYKP